MALYNLDLFGGCEANLNWHKLPDTLCLPEWFCGLPASCTFSAQNVHNFLSKHQYGGTFWFSSGHATQYIIGTTKDPLGSGWWVVCTLTSQTSKKIHLIFGYQPCHNHCSCLCSVYTQHLQYFDSINCLDCPRAAFLADLSAIQE